MPETTTTLPTIPAPVEWAQRSNLVYIRIAVEDVKSPTITVEKDKVVYKGLTGNPPKQYEANLVLFDEINPAESKWVNRDRGTEFVLIKANEGPYWKRLLKDEKKYHWLKVDFNKWKDEDDSDSEGAGGGGGGQDFEEMMRQMGGLGGGAGGLPDLGDLDDEKDNEEDSDDEMLPDLEDKGGDEKNEKSEEQDKEQEKNQENAA